MWLRRILDLGVCSDLDDSLRIGAGGRIRDTLWARLGIPYEYGLGLGLGLGRRVRVGVGLGLGLGVGIGVGLGLGLGLGLAVGLGLGLGIPYGYRCGYGCRDTVKTISKIYSL